MECRNFEITLFSADDLPNVRNFGWMKVYAKISLDRNSETIRTSDADSQRETNPRWDFPVEYIINESTVQQPRVTVVVELFCKRTLGDRFVGEVRIPVKSLFDVGIEAHEIMSYPVTVGETSKGRINIKYRFGENTILVLNSGIWNWKTIGLGSLVMAGRVGIFLSTGQWIDLPIEGWIGLQIDCISFLESFEVDA